MSEPKWSYELPTVESWYHRQELAEESREKVRVCSNAIGTLCWVDGGGCCYVVENNDARWCPIVGPDPGEPWPEGRGG